MEATNRQLNYVIYGGTSFIFTGVFTFGTRKRCREVVTALGSLAPDKKSVTQEVDYLVVGEKGSKALRRETYGRKIEKAVVRRREFGKPAIISEGHWVARLPGASETDI